MKLEEVRKEIDAVDSQMKPLFLSRMVCAKHVAEAKAISGSDVFVAEREDEIIAKRTKDVDEDVKKEYEVFLRHLMSVSRRYQYGILKDMQEKVIADAMKKSGLDENSAHQYVTVSFSYSREKNNLNLYVDMICLNDIVIETMQVKAESEKQCVTLCLQGTIKQANMRQLLCQLGKEADEFQITALN